MTTRADLVEVIARAIAEGNGEDFDAVPKHKSEWVKRRGQYQGRFRDINEPFQSDYLAMAEVVRDRLRLIEMREALEDLQEDFCSRHCINLDNDHFEECLNAKAAMEFQKLSPENRR